MPHAIKITTEQSAALWRYARHHKCRINKASELIAGTGLAVLAKSAAALDPVASNSNERKAVHLSAEQVAGVWVIARRHKVRLGAATEAVFQAGIDAIASDLPAVPDAEALRVYRIASSSSPELRPEGYASPRSAKGACCRLCRAVGGAGLIYQSGRLVLIQDADSRQWLPSSHAQPQAQGAPNEA